jgi:hypothetical protein
MAMCAKKLLPHGDISSTGLCDCSVGEGGMPSIHFRGLFEAVVHSAWSPVSVLHGSLAVADDLSGSDRFQRRHLFALLSKAILRGPIGIPRRAFTQFPCHGM